MYVTQKNVGGGAILPRQNGNDFIRYHRFQRHTA